MKGSGIWKEQQGFQKLWFTNWVVDPLMFILLLFLAFYINVIPILLYLVSI